MLADGLFSARVNGEDKGLRFHALVARSHDIATPEPVSIRKRIHASRSINTPAFA
jgi:hypothetical protein